MYGNVDAALLYFIRFTEYAISPEGLNLTQSKADPCVFYKRNANRETIGMIVVYVDDNLICGNKGFVTEMKIKLKQKFGVVEDGQLKKLLGVRYEWRDTGNIEMARVFLSMDDKAEEIVKEYEKVIGETPKIYKTPGKPGEILRKNEGEPVSLDEYRSILGKIMFYMTKIGPECSFAVGQLARHMHNPGETHWEAMKRTVGYLRGKKSHEVTIRRPKEMRVISLGDASYSDCLDTRRSSTGDIHTTGGALVSWRAQKTPFVCLSSAESEYVVLTEMSKEQRFIEMLLEEVYTCRLPRLLYGDNEAAIFLSKNKQVSPRTKHINIRQHYIREHLTRKYGEIRKIKSEDNLADILSKNVSVKLFERLANGILNGFEEWDWLFVFSHDQRENY